MNSIYHPKPDSIEYPSIKVFVPYCNMQPATAISLIGYDYKPVLTDGDYGYYEYFKKRWEEGKSFINIEQDIVVWPGALKELWDCPREWCMYDIHIPCRWGLDLESPTIGALPLGCMKISKEMIAKTPNLWDKPAKWNELEWRLTPDLLQVHQHYPGVVNANPAYLGGVK